MGIVVAEETTNGILTLRNKALEKLFNALLSIILIGTLLLLFFASNIARRIRKLRDQADNAIDQQGRISTTFTASKSGDEIGDLSRGLSEMVRRLGQYHHYLENLSSRLSHELRTPLGGIKAHAQLALKDKGHEQAALARIVEGVDRTTRIANQLLTLSGIDAMNELDQTDTIDVGSLIERVVLDIDTEISEKSIRVSIRLDTEKRLTGNEALLYILFRNLIDNAVRYSPPGSELKVVYQYEESALALSVIDQGPGISADQRERVFDRFYRDINIEGEGSGLGLAIARKIADLHQAVIVLGATDSGVGLSAKVLSKA